MVQWKSCAEKTKHEESSTGADCLRRGPPLEQINEPSAESPGEKPCAALGETSCLLLHFSLNTLPLVELIRP